MATKAREKLGLKRSKKKVMRNIQKMPDTFFPRPFYLIYALLLN
jgi:hypothetical protein